MSYKLVKSLNRPTHSNLLALQNIYNKSKNKTLKIFIRILMIRWGYGLEDYSRLYGPIIAYTGRENFCACRVIINKRDMSNLVIITSPKKTLILKNVSLWETGSKNSGNFYKELKKLKGHI